jgi:NAD(P)-dependent dehydrogenase (short-subunit alcohol dehydrogenase family)
MTSPPAHRNFITGASRGIGLAIGCAQYARRRQCVKCIAAKTAEAHA